MYFHHRFYGKFFFLKHPLYKYLYNIYIYLIKWNIWPPRWWCFFFLLIPIYRRKINFVYCKHFHVIRRNEFCKIKVIKIIKWLILRLGYTLVGFYNKCVIFEFNNIILYIYMNNIFLLVCFKNAMYSIAVAGKI